MRYSWMICLLVLLFVGRVGAQCPDYTLVLNSQKLVDAFPKGFPNCKELQYALTITGDVNSLDSLIQLRKGETIYIQNNTELTDLTGLSNCKELQNLTISLNSKLADISQVSKIKIISTLIIGNNELLNEIIGFDSILELNHFQISNNLNLKRIDGFRHLEKIKNTLLISQSPFLNDIRGFNKLMEVQGTIYLDNLGISQLDFLPGLSKVGTFRIYMIQNLIDLDYMSSLKEANEIFISNNFNLITTSALKPKFVNVISIYQDSNLLHIDCFDSLKSLKQLYISENIKLKELHASGFTIDSMEMLTIDKNNSLIQIDDFNLSRAIKRLHINNNSNLISADFLKEIHFVDYSIKISENPKLEAIEFINLSKIGKMDLIISKNTSLAKLKVSHSILSHFQRVEIESNPKMKVVQFGPIESSDQVTISNNELLPSLDFLTGIKNISVKLMISENSNLKDLIPLRSLSYFGDLTLVSNEKLANLNGLDSLQSAKSILIANNRNLTSLLTKNAIGKSIEESLVIKENDALKEIDFDFELKDIKSLEIASNRNLETVEISNLATTSDFNLDVNGNASLKSLNLSNIKRMNTYNIANNANLTGLGKSDSLSNIVYLTIENNPKLIDLSALANIASVTNFTITNNQSLLELNQLKALKTISGLATITYNDNLQSLFNDVTQIDSNLTVSNNPKLTDITGLRNITKLPNYVIINNSSLTHCAINSVCKSFENNSNKFFYSNGTGCRYNNEVKDKCSQQNELIVPNPAHTTITFTNKTLVKKVNIAIYDLYGRRIDNFDTTNSTIDISAYSIGTYIFEVSSDQLNFKQKFVKY